MIFLVPKNPNKKKKLIIAEKPSLALKIVEAIGNMSKEDGYYENDNYIVTFAFGHLFVLNSVDDYLNREKTPWNINELPFIPEKFKYKISPDNGIKKQYKIIKQLYQRDDILSIINAGDPDREGSVIILNIYNHLKEETKIEHTIERLWLKATHPEYVKEALRNLHSEDHYGNLYEEGLARTYVDWLYGINYTRYVSIKGNAFLPVGRVLIPIVLYIYNRDKKISQFKPSTFYEIECKIQKDGIEIKCKIDGSKSDTKNETNLLLEQLRQERAFVKKVENKEIVKQAPKLFSLDTLQNKMSQEYKYPSAKTLEIVQSLYEKGYVTYPRTNTEYLSETEKDLVQKILDGIPNLNLRLKDTKSIFDETKIEGHSALIITQKKPDIEKLSEEQKLIYMTIYNRFVSNFLNEKTILNKNTISIGIGAYSITLEGTSIKEEGFYKFEKPPEETFLPKFEENEEVIISSMEVVEKKTQPPARITEADLNKYLKNPFRANEISEHDDEDYKDLLSGCEIGTVATRADIIQNALKYEYIKREKSHLRITDKGCFLINLLNELNINMERESTVKVNMSLKQIYNRKMKLEDLVKETARELTSVINGGRNQEVDKYKNPGICKCPKCENGRILLGKGKDYYYCSEYKTCNFFINVTIAQKKLTETQIKTLLETGKTGLIKGFTSTKKGTKFDARLILNTDMKVEFLFKK